jgi:hypothetical protein
MVTPHPPFQGGIIMGPKRRELWLPRLFRYGSSRDQGGDPDKSEFLGLLSLHELTCWPLRLSSFGTVKETHPMKSLAKRAARMGSSPMRC